MSQDKVTRETIAHQLSKEYGIAYSIIYKKIDTLLRIWGGKILTSNLSINSLGSYKINNKAVRIGRNPKTKEEFEIKARKVISFKKSKKLIL